MTTPAVIDLRMLGTEPGLDLGAGTLAGNLAAIAPAGDTPVTLVTEDGVPLAWHDVTSIDAGCVDIIVGPRDGIRAASLNLSAVLAWITRVQGRVDDPLTFRTRHGDHASLLEIRRVSDGTAGAVVQVVLSGYAAR